MLGLAFFVFATSDSVVDRFRRPSAVSFTSLEAS
jgi:hypothetical protein